MIQYKKMNKSNIYNGGRMGLNISDIPQNDDDESDYGEENSSVGSYTGGGKEGDSDYSDDEEEDEPIQNSKIDTKVGSKPREGEDEGEDEEEEKDDAIDDEDDDDDDDDDELNMDQINDIENELNEDNGEDDQDEEPEDFYLQKFNSEMNKNYIVDYHPECVSNNYAEVLNLAKVVRDNKNNIIDDLHKTIPFLTKYEKTKILGQRAKQINNGAKVFVKVDENVIDGYLIAISELEQKRIPFIIRRPIPGGGCEYWRVSDLENISF
jgi:DNA-directed RNA polymerase I, II, and III subunit RPABC2